MLGVDTAVPRVANDSCTLLMSNPEHPVPFLVQTIQWLWELASQDKIHATCEITRLLRSQLRLYQHSRQLQAC